MTEKPKVSVITVAFNVAAEIEQTIQSVLSQTYANLEYLIIDGGSKDGTVEIIRKCESKLDFWVSEPDGGIYDAMNKGVAKATGDFVVFMNAGDWFKSETVVEEVMNLAPADAEMIYGNHEVVYPNLIKMRYARPPDQLWKGMAFNHQTLFAKKELLVKHPFDLSFRRVADFHFIYHQWRDGRKFFNTGLTVACFRAGGLSMAQSIQTKKDVWKVVRQHQNSLSVNWFHFKLLTFERMVIFLQKLLPERWFFQLMAWKNKG